MSDSDYPSFVHLFVRQPQWQNPLYVYLLQLNDSAVWTMSAIIQSLTHSPDPAREICALLNGLDWREHLVGGIASILGQQQSAPVIAALWSAFDEGSWVSPQLAVVVSLVDPAFAEHARERILQRCMNGFCTAVCRWPIAPTACRCWCARLSVVPMATISGRARHSRRCLRWGGIFQRYDHGWPPSGSPQMSSRCSRTIRIAAAGLPNIGGTTVSSCVRSASSGFASS
jgi:hypothetical protein